MKGKERKRDRRCGAVSATTHNTHCGRGWINSSEDGTCWCNPQPRIMEHHNLKDNALSEQRAREPEREAGMPLTVADAFTVLLLSNILRQQWAETHFGLSWQKTEPFEARRYRAFGEVNTGIKCAEGQRRALLLRSGFLNSPLLLRTRSLQCYVP